MGKYGLAKCPVFKEDGDAWETAPTVRYLPELLHNMAEVVQ